MRRRGRRESRRPDSSGRGQAPVAARRPPFNRSIFRRGAVVSLVASVALLACNEDNRYRVLNFFFDGVPKPGEKKPVGYAVDTSANFPEDPEAQKPKRIERYPHTPYRTGDCGGCHDNMTGQLVALPEEGLCLLCHRGLTADLRYVHGPVAVNACTYCHDPHGSLYPGVLLDEPTKLCLKCHTQGDLGAGAHHERLDITACTDCHGAHGGADPFFLRQNNEN